MKTIKRRRNHVNHRELYDNTIVDGVSGETHEDYLRANVVSKSAKTTAKLNNMHRLCPVPGKLSAKICANPKLTILKLIHLTPWNLISRINRYQFWSV